MIQHDFKLQGDEETPVESPETPEEPTPDEAGKPDENGIEVPA